MYVQCFRFETTTWSSSRWQEESGCKHANKKTADWLQADPDMQGVFESMPTAKVGSVAALQTHILYKTQHMPLIQSHFLTKQHTGLRWRSHRKRQAAMDNMCNAIVGKRCQKKQLTLVGFGNAGFTSAGPTQALRRRLRSRCHLYDVDEFRTSMLCCACHQGMTGMPSHPQGMTSSANCIPMLYLPLYPLNHF